MSLATLITQKGLRSILMDPRDNLEPPLLRTTGQLHFSAENSLNQIELLTIVETLKEFKGMLWGQPIVVYTDHKTHARRIGLTCDRVYRWLLLEEYGPEIAYIKGIHNTYSYDAISRLDLGPIVDVKENWMTFTKCWCYYTMQAEEDPSPVKHSDLMNYVFANRSKENAIYPHSSRLPQLNKRIKR
eukprot:CCRYP_011729-RA/>CCRYP_011729-RA protein AED:0.45 eAED:0.56 QI:0/0/0/1/0/0/2/0/185